MLQEYFPAFTKCVLMVVEGQSQYWSMLEPSARLNSLHFTRIGITSERLPETPEVRQRGQDRRGPRPVGRACATNVGREVMRICTDEEAQIDASVVETAELVTKPEVSELKVETRVSLESACAPSQSSELTSTLTSPAVMTRRVLRMIHQRALLWKMGAGLKRTAMVLNSQTSGHTCGEMVLDTTVKDSQRQYANVHRKNVGISRYCRKSTIVRESK